jgi:hypothetical protein
MKKRTRPCILLGLQAQKTKEDAHESYKSYQQSAGTSRALGVGFQLRERATGDRMPETRKEGGLPDMLEKSKGVL